MQSSTVPVPNSDAMSGYEVPHNNSLQGKYINAELATCSDSLQAVSEIGSMSTPTSNSAFPPFAMVIDGSAAQTSSLDQPTPSTSTPTSSTSSVTNRIHRGIICPVCQCWLRCRRPDYWRHQREHGPVYRD